MRDDRHPRGRWLDASMSRGAAPSSAHAKHPQGRFRAELERLVFSSAIYRLSLIGAAPNGLVQTIAGPAGDARRGAEMLRGEFTIAGERITASNPFAMPAREEVQAALHGFGWLADLRAEGSAAARECCRTLISGWLERYSEWSPLPWRGDVLGRRLVAWLAEYPFFAQGTAGALADDAFRARILATLARQARHLERVALLRAPSFGTDGSGRLGALIGLVYARIALSRAKEPLQRALALLLKEIDRQVLPDGGHFQRSPVLQLDILNALVGVRSALAAGKHALPGGLQGAIDRMAPMLRFFRHGDGGLVLFNHTAEGDAAQIDAALAAADADGTAPSAAPHTGFQRLAAGSALIVMDTGAPAAPESDSRAHAGTLSFELSHGRERVIVNCGARAHASAEWLVAQRATAAHSTLALANANSSEIMADGHLGRRPRHVLCRREEADGAVLIDTSHDGYEPPFGVLHRRRVYLAADGGDVRGEDRLTRIRPGDALALAVRFHLHPDVQASIVHDRTATLLRLPSGVAFRFDASGGRLTLEESIYLGAAAGARRTEQIVVESTLAGEEAHVKWSLRRIASVD
jgi:uncharacterized heparinase superfamily protein